MKLKFYLLLFLIAEMLPLTFKAQCLTPTNFTLQKSVANPIPILNHSMSAKRDTGLLRPYLYVANKAQGLAIYNITSTTTPTLLTTVPSSSLGGLDVNSITQSGNYLYLALGDIFSATVQATGMAIVDVNTPSSPVVKSVFTFTAPSGAGHVAVEGNYAYLSGMQNGILVFDVTNKSSISLLSQFKPTMNFPVNNPSASAKLKINARSMIVKNNVIYLCYDAGGIRVINASNKSNLKETGKYCNTVLSGSATPRAYNNAVIEDTLMYVATDYAGLEVLNIKDTSNIKKIGWWNPWNAGTPSNNWFNSLGHTNEIEYDPNCKMVFMSAGKTDLIAVSVANPALPDSCSQYGSKTDSIGTWGLGHYKNQIYLCYMTTWPLFTPFRSEWSGVKILSYNNSCFTGFDEFDSSTSITGYPNPANNEYRLSNPFQSESELFVYDTEGKLVAEKKCSPNNAQITINTNSFLPGIYFIKLRSSTKTYTSKLIVQKQ